MASLQELLAQKAEIDRQISDARRQERNEAIAKVRALMAEHGLTAADLVAKAPGPRASTSGRQVAAQCPGPGQRPDRDRPRPEAEMARSRAGVRQATDRFRRLRRFAPAGEPFR